MTNNSKSNPQRRGVTAAGLGGLALASVLLLCGAGNAPIENFTPQGAMQADLNAGGHSVTNAATVSATNVGAASLTAAGASVGTLTATNVTVSGALTATNFTLPFSSVTARPTTVAGYGISDAEKQAAAIATGVAAPTRLVLIGDSITAGGPAYGGTGWQTAYGSQLSDLSFARDSQIFVCGEPSQNSITLAADYAGADVTTTVTTTAGSTAATLGSVAGVSTGYGIGAASVPAFTTLTLGAGNAVTLSNAATISETVTCALASPPSYNFAYISGPVQGYNEPSNGNYATTYVNFSGGLVANPHLLSPAVMGGSAIAVLYLFTNDYVECGTTNETGTLTAGSNIITGIPSTAAWSVGYYLSATAGIPYGATITSIDSSSQVHMSVSATASGTAVPVATASPSSVAAFESSATSLINKCLADGYSVMINTTFPNYTMPQSACQNFRLLFNNYLYATYGGAAYGGSNVAGVTLFDLGTSPEFQSSFADHLKYYQPGGLHPSDAGYTVMADDINYALCANFPVVAHANTTGQIQNGQLSEDVPYGINNVYTLYGIATLIGSSAQAAAFQTNNTAVGGHLLTWGGDSGNGVGGYLFDGTDGGYVWRGDSSDNFIVTHAIETGVGFQDTSGGTHVSAPVSFDAGGNLVPFALSSTGAASVAMTVGQSYQPTGGSAQAFLLPATAAVGKTVAIIGTGAGGWTVTQGAGQTVRWNGSATTAGTAGYVQSANADSCVALTCTVANTTWTVTSHEGSITLH